MKDRYAVEVRKLSVKVRQQDAHIDILNERIEKLQNGLRLSNEIMDNLRAARRKLEEFVKFANEYYPGSVDQFHAIKKLEGDKP
jgi:exonuclease VII small subunit